MFKLKLDFVIIFPRPGEFTELQGGECHGGDHPQTQQHRHNKKVMIQNFRLDKFIFKLK